jgi:hypothetical protein
MINVGDMGNMAHEHLEYYTLHSLEALLQRHGLEIYKLETNNANGESYRLFIQHHDWPIRPVDKSVPIARNTEKDVLKRLMGFTQHIASVKREVVAFIEDVTSRGNTVWVYGASTKGNTILQYFGLYDSLISGAAERDPDKWGLVTIGSNILIHSEHDARRVDPDYFLVLPYAFMHEFVMREKAWKEAGGLFIVPFPEMTLV